MNMDRTNDAASPSVVGGGLSTPAAFLTTNAERRISPRMMKIPGGSVPKSSQQYRCHHVQIGSKPSDPATARRVDVQNSPSETAKA